MQEIDLLWALLRYSWCHCARDPTKEMFARQKVAWLTN